jgi:hypothetical protein
LSFWVKSSLTGTFGGIFGNNDFNRSYPFTYTISAANTWEQKSITVAGDTTGTWNTTNSAGIQLYFGLGVGSTYSGTAGSWQASGLISATGAVNLMGTLNATWQITGVQLEVGTQATSFEYRQYGQELALCQRYYWNVAKGINLNINGYCFSATQYNAPITFPVQMRASPSLNIVTGSGFYALDSTFPPPALTVGTIFRPTQYGALIYFTTTGMVAGYAGGINMDNASCNIAFSAEL